MSLPGTPDGDLCRKWVDIEEPLLHNKTAFPVILFGFDETNRSKTFNGSLIAQLLLISFVILLP
jgi:hypothetical protein